MLSTESGIRQSNKTKTNKTKQTSKTKQKQSRLCTETNRTSIQTHTQTKKHTQGWYPTSKTSKTSKNSTQAHKNTHTQGTNCASKMVPNYALGYEVLEFKCGKEEDGGMGRRGVVREIDGASGSWV